MMTDDKQILVSVLRCAQRLLPQKPSLWGDGYDDQGNMNYDSWDCPNCGKTYEVDYEHYDYCPKCGQAIDWEEVE